MSRSVATSPTPLMQFLDSEPYVTEPRGSSTELLKVTREALSLRHQYFDKDTVTRRNEMLEERFRRLVESWAADTAFESSPARMTAHPAYREIVALGEEVVPLLLRELDARPNFWFAALREIAGANPVRDEDRGDFENMRQAWLRWGREQGF